MTDAQAKKPAAEANPQSATAQAATTQQAPPVDGGWRETIEQLAIALTLALTFRTFVAEMFVIPTGSMAPTLMGRHRDFECEKCGCPIRANASVEERQTYRVVAAKCPQCQAVNPLDPEKNWNQDSFAGDRIIVSKVAGEPKRWDVIVFKNPMDAKVNFIKRLVGLPGERFRIAGGNIYTAPASSPDRSQLEKEPDDYAIARKPDDVLLAMLQPVFEADYVAEDLRKMGWPSRWQAFDRPSGQWQGAWKVAEDQRTFSVAKSDAWSELRYRHFEPRPGFDAEKVKDRTAPDREIIAQTQMLPEDMDAWRGGLIADSYAYNASRHGYPQSSALGNPPHSAYYGAHWVGDLALEATIATDAPSGEVAFDLVRAGVTCRCVIDLQTGVARAQRIDFDGSAIPFGEQGNESPTAKTSVLGAGRWSIRWSNVDDELRLWVNDRRVLFDAPTTFTTDWSDLPKWTDENPGDLAPAGIAAKGVGVKLSHVRLLRDKYYIAVDGALRDYSGQMDDYYLAPSAADLRRHSGQGIAMVLANPSPAEVADLLVTRVEWRTELRPDQFLPLGDNSPASQDGRFWPEHHFDRKLLIGKALFVHWPHSWWNPPFWPDWKRMRSIH